MINTTVKLNVTHSKHKITAIEIRFDLTQTIYSVKEALHRRFGTAPDYQILKLQDEAGNTICSMDDNDAILARYNPADFYTIHILDNDPNSFSFDNEESVPKYEISDEDYQKRQDSFRKFKEQNIKRTAEPEQKRAVDPEVFADAARGISVGQRCRINPGDKRGTVLYVGKVPEAQTGWFVGVALDEPYGKNDGTIKGKRYFECLPNYGLFLRPNALEVGDFPPLDEEEI